MTTQTFQDALNIVQQECLALLNDMDTSIDDALLVLPEIPYNNTQVLNLNAFNIYARFKESLNNFKREIEYETSRLNGPQEAP